MKLGEPVRMHNIKFMVWSQINHLGEKFAAKTFCLTVQCVMTVCTQKQALAIAEHGPIEGCSVAGIQAMVVTAYGLN